MCGDDVAAAAFTLHRERAAGAAQEFPRQACFIQYSCTIRAAPQALQRCVYQRCVAFTHTLRCLRP